MVVKDKSPVVENGVDAPKQQQQQQVDGAPSAPSWMSQRKKRRGIKAKRAARGSKKRCAKEASNDDENDEVVDDEEQGKKAPTRKPGRPGRPIPFLPSAALQLVMKRRAVLRRTAVSSDLATRLRTMQCPFLWELETAPKDLSDLYRQLDDTPHRPTPWHVAVLQIQQAYEFARHRMVWKSRELLEDVYSLVAEAQAQGDDDALVNKYKEGLKHVLDCCWLLVRDDRDATTGVPLPDGTAAELVTEFDALNDKQKASVWAIRAIMSDGNARAVERAVERALNLDGSEGQWLYVKASSERSVRARKQDVDVIEELSPRYTAEEVESFRKACDRRKSPQTLLRLADCYLNGPTENHQLCTKLVREALDRYPLSAYAQLKSALIFSALSHDRKDKDSRCANICYSQAVHLARSWPQANLEYGLYWKNIGNIPMALHYLELAGDLSLV